MEQSFSAARGVGLHQTWRRRGTQEAIAALLRRGQAPDGPGRGLLEIMAAPDQIGDRRGSDALLDREMPRSRFARIEGRGEVLRVEQRQVDRLLQVETVVHPAQEHAELPLLLLVAARRAESQAR